MEIILWWEKKVGFSICTHTQIFPLTHQSQQVKALQYLEVLVEADYSGWCEGQRQEVGEGEPEPELGEDQQADH